MLTAVVILGGSTLAGCFGGPPPPPPANIPPFATTSSSASFAAEDESVTYTGAGNDFDGSIASWAWNFGDGGSATTQNATHAFTDHGLYYVTLTVTDNAGGTYSTVSSGAPLRTIVLPKLADTDTPTAALALDSETSIIAPNTQLSWSAKDSRGKLDVTTDTRSTVVNYAMAYGDGGTEAHDNASLDSGAWNGLFNHTYATAGIFTAKLTITTDDATGNTDVTGYTVIVAAVTPTPGIKNPDTMIIQSFGQANNLDPAIAYDDASNQVIQALYETLVTYEGAQADKFVPLLVEQVPTETNGLITNAGTTYTFNLKHGITFHSGDVFNAHDVVFSFQRIIDMDDPASAAWIYTQVMNNTSIVAIDDYTVQFNLMFAYGPFISTLAYAAASIVSKETVLAHPNAPTDLSPRNTWMLTHADGTGPFRLRSWTNGQQLVLDKNHGYWNASGMPKMEHVILQLVIEFSTMFLNLKSGAADIISVNAVDRPAIQTAAADLANQIEIKSGAGTWVISNGHFNQNIDTSPTARAKLAGVPSPDNVPSDFFADVNMRKAFSLAFNYTDYIVNVGKGLAFRSSGIIPKGMYGYNAGLAMPQYDIEAARAAYNLTRWATDSTYNPAGRDGGFNLTVAYNCGNANRERYGLILKGTPANPGVEQLGPNIHINVFCLEFSTYLDLISPPGGPPAGLGTWVVGWGPDYADPDDYIKPFLETGNLYPTYNGISYPELDANITAAAAMPNSPARQALYDSIQTFAVENYLYVYNVESLNFHVSKSWVKGWYFNPMWSGADQGGNLAQIYKA